MALSEEASSFIKEIYKAYSEDDCFTFGAALAYYTVFSLAPIFFIIISITGTILGPNAVRGEIYHQLEGFLGHGNALQVQDLIRHVYQNRSGTIETLLGVLTLILGATGALTHLKKSLNIIWKIEAQARNGIFAFLFDRFISFTLVMAIGLVLLLAMLAEAFAAFLSQFIEYWLPYLSTYFLLSIDFAISIVLTTLFFAFIYKFLPDARIRWSDVIVGAFVTALLFSLGKLGIGLYLSKSHIGTAFGTSGFLVVLLVWVYFSSQILFLGAEFTYVYAKRYGSGINPRQYGVKTWKTDQ